MRWRAAAAIALVTAGVVAVAAAGDAHARRKRGRRSSTVRIEPRTPDGLPNVQAESAIVVDMRDGAVIYEKNADQVRPIASTGKIFVAMVTRRHAIDLEAATAITEQDRDLARGGARTRLDVGYAFRHLDLLRAMLIASDNRAPSALGRAVGLAPDQLVAAMNSLARDLGLTHTRFTDPSGLNGNVSTAREMAVAFGESLRDDLLREIMGTRQVDVTAVSPRSRVIRYFNTNRSLNSGRYTVIAGKTGYTDEAQYCLLIAARVGGRDVIMVFLGARGKLTRYGDFNRVVEWMLDGAPRPR